MIRLGLDYEIKSEHGWINQSLLVSEENNECQVSVETGRANSKKLKTESSDGLLLKDNNSIFCQLVIATNSIRSNQSQSHK